MSNTVYIIASYHSEHEQPHYIKAFLVKSHADEYLLACKKHHKNKRFAPKVLEGPEFEEFLDYDEQWRINHPAGTDHVNKSFFRMLEIPLEQKQQSKEHKC
jgi:hypothetical protein